MIATQMLARVEAQRLQKAVEGLASGAYTITVTGQRETEIRGFVANGDGKEYGVVLSEEHAFCSCKDAMYRKGVCKHVIRTPQAEAKPAEMEAELEERPVNLKLGKVRKGFAFSA